MYTVVVFYVSSATPNQGAGAMDIATETYAEALGEYARSVEEIGVGVGQIARAVILVNDSDQPVALAGARTLQFPDIAPPSIPLFGEKSGVPMQYVSWYAKAVAAELPAVPPASSEPAAGGSDTAAKPPKSILGPVLILLGVGVGVMILGASE